MNTKYCHLTTLAVILFSMRSFAQEPAYYIITNGGITSYATGLVQLSGNRHLLLGDSRFGFDSSYVTLTWIDEEGIVSNHKEYRMQLPLTFFFSGMKAEDGYMLSGLNYSTAGSYPLIVAFDSSGLITRFQLVTSNSLNQENILKVLPGSGSDFTAYTSTSNLYEGIYRIEGNLTNSVLSFTSITSPSDHYIRPFDVNALSAAGEHLIAGSVYLSGGTQPDALMMKLNDTHVIWSRRLDFGYTLDESLSSILQLSNGNLVMTGTGVSAVSTYFDGFILCTDTAGQVLWSRKLTRNLGGVYPAALAETSSGNIIVCGNTENYSGLVLQFDPSGNLLSERTLPPDQGIVFMSDLIRNEDGSLAASGYVGGSIALWRMDANGIVCNFQSGSTVNSADFDPETSLIDFSVSADNSVEYATYNYSSRNLAVSSTAACIGVYVESIGNQTELGLFPNPVSGLLQIESSGLMRELTIYTLEGSPVFSRQLAGLKDEINLSGLPGGIYLVLVTLSNQQAVYKILVKD